MIVYGSSMSPFVRKVIAFGFEKGIALQIKPLGLGSDDPDFLEASPFGKIPAFRDGDFVLSDSSAIIAYLDCVRPEPNLIPAEAKARARTIWFEEFADTMLAACAGKIFFNRIVAPRFLGRPGDLEAAERAEKDELPRLLDYLEGALPESLFLVEDRITLADIAVASPLANFRHLGLDLEPERRPRLARFSQSMLSRESFKTSIDKESAFLERSLGG